MKNNLNLIFTGMTSLAVLLLGGSCAAHKNTAANSSAAVPAVAAAPAAAPEITPPIERVVAPAGKITLTLVKVDSEETAGENGRGANTVDGDPNTLWHTQWQDASPECPHEIVIELTPPAPIQGFTYLPRQDESDHGEVKGYEFFTSNDGDDFGRPVAQGEFAEGKELKTVTFAPKTCRFIKLKALSEINGEAWTSAAEIGVVR